MNRDPDLQAFLDASAQALRACTNGAAAAAAQKAIGRWDSRTGKPAGLADRLPVCDWIARTLEQNRGPRENLAEAFGLLQSRLNWKRRGSARPDDDSFWHGHANATILGPGGLEERDDLWVGATVMAPGVCYARHDHPPEEVYLSLTPGEWWNEAMDWTDPGPDSAIYNPPGIEHAMRSGDGPFLALWYLPL